eukprot:6074540-Amphidinium_carterae.1
MVVHHTSADHQGALAMNSLNRLAIQRTFFEVKFEDSDGSGALLVPATEPLVLPLDRPASEQLQTMPVKLCPLPDEPAARPCVTQNPEEHAPELSGPEGEQ